MSMDLLKAFLVFLVIQAALVGGGVAPFADGDLSDPDAYMRLNRVVHLWESGAWFDPVYPRISPPDGHVQHWTRPMDMVLLAGALVGAPFVGFEKALFGWSVAISPLMQLPTLLALVWAAAPLVQRSRLWLVSILFVIQPAALLTFLIGRPDHNALLILCFVLSIGLTIRLLLQPERRRNAALAGVVAALALWISMETLLFVVVGIAVPGVFWVLGDRRLAQAMLAHAAALLGTLLLVLLLERGIGRLAVVEFDQTSLAHVVLFAINLVFWSLIYGAGRLPVIDRRPIGRVAVGALAGSAALAALWLLVPGFFASPLAGVDPLYRDVRLVNIQEFQPIIRLTDLWSGEAAGAIGRLLLWLGIGVVAIPYVLRKVWTAAGPERAAWSLLAALAVVFIPLAVGQVRWAAYAEIAMVIPYAVAVGGVVAWLRSFSFEGPLMMTARACIVAGACVWYFLPVSIVGPADAEEGEGEGVVAGDRRATCPLRPLTAFLSDPDGLGAREERVLAFVDFGPELLYRTPHSVFSIPNHRFQPGFTAAYRIMSAADDAPAEELIRRHQVDLLLICPRWPVEAAFYQAATNGEIGFYDHLAEDVVPDFLEPLELPTEAAEQFRLFRVRP
ncbi:MAG: hypothetical protein HKM95_02190 [Inquilinus sp.]|nr:hypothetical protein [Inquilinus sp.]